jgi:UDP-N-acetylglucosamine 2-epimerase
MGRKIVTIVGTRPQFIKAAALDLDDVLVHTGQHYGYGLSKKIWDGLKLREPDFVLSCASYDPTIMMSRLVDQIGSILIRVRADYVIVIGDCNSTLGGALAAALLKIPVIHIEAGLRCFDMNMPEERNRKLVDHLAQVNFCISDQNKFQIHKEKFLDPKQNHIYVVGDLLYDVMLSHISKAVPMIGNYYLATVHREENANEHLDEILEGLDGLNKKVIFPKHPRIKLEKKYSNIEFMGPVDYLTMLSLQLGADMIFTDSGGVQREAVWLGKPCVLLRDKTEFPQFVNYGHVILAGYSKDKIVGAVSHEWPDEPLDHGQDGQAAKRITEIIHEL